MKHIHKPMVAIAISLAAMFIAVPVASATQYPLGVGTETQASPTYLYSGGPSENNSVLNVFGSGRYLCAEDWAYGQTIYEVGDGQLQANNIWFFTYQPYMGVYAGSGGWGNSDFIQLLAADSCAVYN